MRTHAQPIGWGWAIRAVAGIVGVALAFFTTPALRAQQASAGRWAELPYTMPINPVHTALTYDGKVLIVSGSGNVATETNFRAAVWNLQANTITTQSLVWD